MDLQLTDDDAALLQQVLSSAFRELRMEIAQTDNAEYRHALNARKATIASILDRLGGLVEPS